MTTNKQSEIPYFSLTDLIEKLKVIEKSRDLTLARTNVVNTRLVQNSDQRLVVEITTQDLLVSESIIRENEQLNKIAFGLVNDILSRYDEEDYPDGLLPELERLSDLLAL